MDLESKVKKVRWGPPAELPAAPAGVPLPPAGRTDGRTDGSGPGPGPAPAWAVAPARALGSAAERCAPPAALLPPVGRRPPVPNGIGVGGKVRGRGSCPRDVLLLPRPQAELNTSPLIKTLQFVPQVAKWYLCPSMQALLSFR